MVGGISDLLSPHFHRILRGHHQSQLQMILRPLKTHLQCSEPLHRTSTVPLGCAWHTIGCNPVYTQLDIRRLTSAPTLPVELQSYRLLTLFQDLQDKSS